MLGATTTGGIGLRTTFVPILIAAPSTSTVLVIMSAQVGFVASTVGFLAAHSDIVTGLLSPQTFRARFACSHVAAAFAVATGIFRALLLFALVYYLSPITSICHGHHSFHTGR